MSEILAHKIGIRIGRGPKQEEYNEVNKYLQAEGLHLFRRREPVIGATSISRRYGTVGSYRPGEGGMVTFRVALHSKGYLVRMIMYAYVGTWCFVTGKSGRFR